MILDGTPCTSQEKCPCNQGIVSLQLNRYGVIALIFTSEEIAMIEGVLGSFFSDNHTSEDLRKAYSRVWQHLAADTLDSEDLRRISSAVDFAMKNQFCESCSRESQRVLTTVLIKSISAQ